MTIRWTVAVSWIALVVAGSLLPGTAFEGSAIPVADIAAHFVGYGIMAILVLNVVRRPSLGRCVLVTASCGLLGAVLEVAQHFVPGRAMSVGDAAANILGAAAASAAYAILRRKRSRGA